MEHSLDSIIEMSNILEVVSKDQIKLLKPISNVKDKCASQDASKVSVRTDHSRNHSHNDNSSFKRKNEFSDDVVSDEADPDFVWEDYLEETKSTAAPPIAFTHVEYSLESGFKMGMKLEVPNREQAEHYWLASVIMTCGPLLSLRYAGYGDDRSADFWFDVKSGDVHPIGWSNKNNKIIFPPEAIRKKHKDWQLLLEAELHEATTVPFSLLEDPEAGITPIDQIKQGMKLEVTEDHNPQNVWVATVIENVGGRLLLRNDGIKSTFSDFWLFYLSPRVHELGWGAKHNLSYHPPGELKNQETEEKWQEILKISFKEAESFIFPANILEPQQLVERHGFQEGMKLEVLNYFTLLHLSVATVTKIINDYYFLVEIDDYRTDEKNSFSSICCHSNSHVIFPVNWAKENGLRLDFPKGYKEYESSKDFDWEEYLTFSKAKPAPKDLFLMNYMNMGFEYGMKLEAVNPFQPHQICAATVQKIVEPLMWIKIDSIDSLHAHHVTTVNSLEIFPVGWCESNSYPLKPPQLGKLHCKRIKSGSFVKEQKFQEKNNIETVTSSPKDHGKAWCPKIYFNHRCFSGPLLSKGRLAELPKQVGPGSVGLVMKEVLTLLISVAYKSSRVLRELQMRGKPDPMMQQQVIKAKYKGKSYRATVELIRHSDQVEEFCRMICTKLECCPYLFGPHHVGDDCPEKCYTLTKTKYSYNFGKKHKKPGRPPIILRSELSVKKGPGRKKKRRHWRLLNTTLYSSNNQWDKKQSSDESQDKKADACKEISVKDRSTFETSDSELNIRTKFKTTNIPKSEIVTRGAKLPNFGLEMKWRHHISPFLPRKVGRPPNRPVSFVSKKVGRPLGSSKKLTISVPTKQKMTDINIQSNDQKETKDLETWKGPPQLASNPLSWSVEEVVKYVKDTECAPIARILREQEIDGQALLMLTLSSVQEFLHLKLGPAIKFCSIVERLKLAFYSDFC